MVTAAVSAASSDAMPASSSHRTPRRRVMPNADTTARSFSPFTSRKNAASLGLLSGYPPST